MTNSRLIGGVALVGAGILVMGFSLLGGIELMIGLSIYSIPLIVIGMIIALNKGADKIEQINYSKIKRRK